MWLRRASQRFDKLAKALIALPKSVIDRRQAEYEEKKTREETESRVMGVLEAVAIILSVVSLVVSIVAFFASLKFYRDGVQLQQSANDALTRISEKTEFIQTQVGGMFDKTLDAAIGRKEILSDQFEELNQQLEATKAKLIEESIGQIGAAGEQERKRLSKIVDNQMELIRAKVETTRESAEEMVERDTLYLTPLMYSMMRVINRNPQGQTIRQIADKLDGSPSVRVSLAGISQRLKGLTKSGLVEFRDGKYYPHTGQ